MLPLQHWPVAVRAYQLASPHESESAQTQKRQQVGVVSIGRPQNLFEVFGAINLGFLRTGDWRSYVLHRVSRNKSLALRPVPEQPLVLVCGFACRRCAPLI